MEKVGIGDVVVFVDQHGREHDALVTAVWGHFSQEERHAELRRQYELAKEVGATWATEEWFENSQLPVTSGWVYPSLNVVYVSSDETQQDSYGRQIVRATSTPARTAQPAHGFYWKNR